MGKGLPRSQARGNVLRQEIITRSIPFNDLVVNVAATGVAIGFGTSVLEGLPEGNILLLGAVADVIMSGPVGGSVNLVDAWNGDFAIGSAPTADNALAGAEVDIVPSTAIGPAVAEASPRTAGRSTSAISGTVLDNTAADLEINVNMLIDAADITDDTNVDLTISGALHISYIMLGDD